MPADRFDSALCIRHWEWSESSQVVALFTRTRGVVRALAKGSRRPNHPFSGGVELLTLGDAGLIIKPDLELAQLTEWDLRDPLAHFRDDLRLFNAGMFIADLIRHVVIDAEPHAALFDHTVAALRALAGGPRLIPGVLLRLQWTALVEAGYEPRFDPLHGAGVPVGAAAEFHFDPAEGGMVVGATPSSWRMTRQTLGLLRTLKTLAPDQRSTASAPAVARAAAFLAAYLGWVLGRPIPTAALVLPGSTPTSRVRYSARS
ncbi:hypothetical protein BH11PLA1_BH11PLA1_05560 [soil metagenome]